MKEADPMLQQRRILVCLLSSILLLSACLYSLIEPRTAPDRPGRVGRVVRQYQDHDRLSWDRSGSRPLTTVVWYPANEHADEQEWLLGPARRPLFSAGWSAPGAELAATTGTYPLILLSHGTGGTAAQLSWLAEHLAARGMMVAAVNHHGNTAAEPDPAPQGFLLWWERATDLRVVLDHLLEDPRLGPRIDHSRIGMAGFSLGGYTVLALAGARTSLDAFTAFCAGPEADATCQSPPELPQAVELFERLRQSDQVVTESLGRHGESYRDQRIRSAYIIAPSLGMALTERSLQEIDIPLRIVVGDADSIAPPDLNATRIASLAEGCEIDLLPGVGHYTFLAECTAAGKQYLPICTDNQGVDRARVHQQVAADAFRFFSRTLSHEPQAPVSQ
jgi:predicted dienelactone hydrolase